MPGYISLHRDIQKHWLYEEKRKFSKYEAWVDILLRVNHAEAKVIHNGSLETVLRGSTIWSMGDMEDHWGWSNSKVKAFLKRLENDGMLIVKSTTKKTYITVVNYDFYQGSDIDKTPPKHHQNTTDHPTKHTNNNDNNKHNKNTRPKPAKTVYDEQSIPYRLAIYLLNKILAFKPDLSKPNIQTWSDDMRKLIEINKRDPKEIGKVIDWVTNDDFWKVNILCPSKLREKWDSVTAKMASQGERKFRHTEKIVAISDFQPSEEDRKHAAEMAKRQGLQAAHNE